MLSGPICENCFNRKGGSCSEEQIDVFCYAHGDDDKGTSSEDAFKHAAKLYHPQHNPFYSAALHSFFAPMFGAPPAQQEPKRRHKIGCAGNTLRKCKPLMLTGPDCEACLDKQASLRSSFWSSKQHAEPASLRVARWLAFVARGPRLRES